MKIKWEAAAVTLAAGDILSSRTLLGVAGTLGNGNAGDVAGHELMVAGYGCPTYNTISGGYLLAHNPITTAWFFDDSQVIALPAELGSTALLSTVTVFNVLVGASIASARVATYRKSGSTYTQIGVSAATGTWTTNKPAILSLTTPLTVASGDRVAVEITLASPGEVSIGKVGDVAVTGNLAYSQSNAMPASFVVEDMEHTLSDRPLAMRAYVATSAKRVVLDTSAFTGAATTYKLGSFHTAPYWVVIENAQVEAGKTLQFDFKNLQTESTGGNNLKLVTSQSLVLDMGDADQITWCGASVALDASEAGDVFDFYLWVDPVNRKSRLFFTNKTTGQSGVAGYPTTRCHPVAVAEAAAPGTGRDVTNTTYPGDASDSTRVQHWQTVTATATGGSGATIGSMGIARKPWFVCAASYGGQTNPPWGRNHVSAELHDPAVSGFAYQPWIIPLCIGGDRLQMNTTTSVSWWRRYGLATAEDELQAGFVGSPSTVGLHDYCEIRDAVFLIVGYAINGVLACDADYLRLQSSLVPHIIGQILYHSIGGVAARNCEVVITSSVPAASSAGDAGGIYTVGTTLRHRLDSALPGMCSAAGAVFVPITSALAAVPGATNEILSTAVEDATNKGHLSQAGDRLVAAMISHAYESGGS